MSSIAVVFHCSRFRPFGSASQKVTCKKMAENNRYRRTTCRNLMQDFEEGDPEQNSMRRLEDDQRQNAELENAINIVLGTNLQSKIRKWNFDFINETPLEGDWDWDFDAEENAQKREELPGAEKPPGDDVPKNKFIHIR